MQRIPLLAGLLLTLVAPSAAQAATASVSQGVLTYRGVAGEQNDFGIDQRPDGYLLQDNTARITAGSGCVGTTDEYGNNAARCTGVTAIRVELGDRGDALRVIGPVAAPVSYAGGTGHDLALYLQQGGPLSVSNDGVANDGPAGVDDIGTDVEQIFGTTFADQLRAGPRGADIWPGTGDDTLTGGNGNDTLRAAYVEDVGTEAGSFYAEGADTVSCGGGRDLALSDRGDSVARDCEVVAVDSEGGGFSVTGSSLGDRIGPLPYGWGPATARAGPGNDTIRTAEMRLVWAGRGNDRVIGFDQAEQTLRGERGNDRIDARDKNARSFNRDVVRCGPGRDLVYANRNDSVSRDCERVKRRG